MKLLSRETWKMDIITYEYDDMIEYEKYKKMLVNEDCELLEHYREKEKIIARYKREYK